MTLARYSLGMDRDRLVGAIKRGGEPEQIADAIIEEARRPVLSPWWNSQERLEKELGRKLEWRSIRTDPPPAGTFVQLQFDDEDGDHDGPYIGRLTNGVWSDPGGLSYTSEPTHWQPARAAQPKPGLWARLWRFLIG